MPMATMPRMSKRQLDRLSEKYHRLAYEMEYDAARLKMSGHESYANAMRALSSSLGDLARGIGTEITPPLAGSR